MGAHVTHAKQGKTQKFDQKLASTPEDISYSIFCEKIVLYMLNVAVSRPTDFQQHLTTQCECDLLVPTIRRDLDCLHISKFCATA
jgi:hypothetical protein